MAGEYSQAALEPELTEEIRDHLSHCPACKKEYQKTETVLSLLKKDRYPDPDPEFWKGLNARIMAQIPLRSPEAERIPWYKRIWEMPFLSPGYAWATALILILLTPVVFYTMQYRGPISSGRPELAREEVGWEISLDSMSVSIESLNPRESSRLREKVVARMGKDLPAQTRIWSEDDFYGDISPGLEGLNKKELEALEKKLQIGGPTGFKEEDSHVS